jgi:hypothetical protein
VPPPGAAPVRVVLRSVLYGRPRRAGTGFDHQRPEKRHRETGGADDGATATGRVTSRAAAMAAASSMVGSGETE